MSYNRPQLGNDDYKECVTPKQRKYMSKRKLRRQKIEIKPKSNEYDGWAS